MPRVVMNILFTLGLLLLWPLLLIYALLKGERINDRLGLWGDLPKDMIWIHSASLGEARVAMLFHKLIENDFPNVLYTVTTKSGYDALSKRRMEYLRNFVLDHPFIVNRTLKKYRPKAIFIAETELWVNLITIAGGMGIPIYIVNGRISSKTYRFTHFLEPRIEKYIKGFAMIDEGGRKRLLEMGVNPAKISVTGNIKSAFSPSTGERKEYQFLKGKRVVTFGSVRQKEEKDICDVVSTLKKKYEDLIWVIAPRHLDRVRDIAELFDEYALFSEERISEVIIVDGFGQLLSLYGISEIAFVGGTLYDYGGHNPLEPAWFGVPVVFGPDVSSSPDSFNRLLGENGGIMVSDAEELTEAIDRLLSNTSVRQTMGQNSRKALDSLSQCWERYRGFFDQLDLLQ